MTTATIRRATVADLPAVYAIWYAHEIEDDPHPPPPGDPVAFRHVLDTGEMSVAERDGRVVGFAAAVTRDAITYLTDLFVRPEHQSAAAGKALLQHALPQDGRIRCTLSSRDPRALALYVRAGMRPRWPNLWLRANTADLGDLPGADVEIAEARAGAPELLCWDAEIGGRRRSEDHAHWVEWLQAIPVWFRRQGRTMGYGYLQQRSPSSLWSPDAITLGPIGARTADDALAAVCAAVRRARSRTAVLRVAVPGPHPALAPLLDAGFRITYVETFVSSATAPFFDPEHYLSSGDLL